MEELVNNPLLAGGGKRCCIVSTECLHHEDFSHVFQSRVRLNFNFNQVSRLVGEQLTLQLCGSIFCT